MATDVEHEGRSPERSPEDGGWSGSATQPVARMSLKSPAVIVVAIALVILIGGIIASVLATGGSATLNLKSVTLTDGTVVQLEPGLQALKPIETDGEPASDILAALAVPAGTRVTGSRNTDQGTTQFDRTVDFTSSLPAFHVQDFYLSIFKQLGWKVIANGPDGYQTGATQVLAQKGSNDGFYWEVGVVISPTSSSGVTPFSLRLFQVQDNT